MRSLQMFGWLAVVCVFPTAAKAQPGKYSAAVVLPEIQMRAGGSWQYPPTGKLKKGEQVIIHHEDGGWIAIIPPVGTVSWINHRFLGEFDPNASGKQNALVMADNVEVRVGSEKGGPLSVSHVKLPRGTFVEIAGPKMREESSTWYPIVPPEGEYRWLPKEALGSASPLAPPPVFVKTTGGQSTNDKSPALVTSIGQTPLSTQHPQWDKAEQAERAGDFATAEKLYTIIYQDLRQKNADPELVLVCYNRLIKCQDRLRSGGNTVTPSPASLQPPSGIDPKNGKVGVGVAWPADPKTAASGQKWTGVGNLRRAGFSVDGKQAYALADSRGQVMYYVTAGNGVGLDSYVNRSVDLLGTVQVRGEIRGGQYMVVSQVNPR